MGSGRREEVLGSSRSARRSNSGPSPRLGAATRVRFCWCRVAGDEGVLGAIETILRRSKAAWGPALCWVNLESMVAVVGVVWC
jgi:hypothetical protein